MQFLLKVLWGHMLFEVLAYCLSTYIFPSSSSWQVALFIFSISIVLLSVLWLGGS
jgi:hypothetical protein